MSALVPFPEQPERDVRVDWLTNLAALVHPMDPPAALKAMRPFLALLTLPAAAYCPKSLRHCASALKHVPSYGELDEALGKWWHDHRPWEPDHAAPRLEERTPPTEEEKAHVHAAVASIVAELRSSAAPRGPHARASSTHGP